MSKVRPIDSQPLGGVASDAMAEVLHQTGEMGPARFSATWTALRMLAVDAYLMGASSKGLSEEDAHRIVTETKEELGILPGMATPTYHGITEAIALTAEKARYIANQVDGEEMSQ